MKKNKISKKIILQWSFEKHNVYIEKSLKNYLTNQKYSSLKVIAIKQCFSEAYNTVLEYNLAFNSKQNIFFLLNETNAMEAKTGGYAPVEEVKIDNESINGIVALDKDKIEENIYTLEKAIKSNSDIWKSKKDQDKVLKTCFNALACGMLVHEFVHAISTNLENPIFSSTDIGKLELLTDAISYISIAPKFEDDASLGLYYLKKSFGNIDDTEYEQLCKTMIDEFLETNQRLP